MNSMKTASASARTNTEWLSDLHSAGSTARPRWPVCG